MMSQMLSVALPGTTSFGIISSSMTWHWNLTHSHPASGGVVHHPKRLGDVALVVDADLGDHERWCVVADEPALDAELGHPRIFSTSALVECPGSIAIRTTRPPRASTISRPTMASARPVGALHEDVRLQRPDHGVRRVLVEYDDAVHACERGQDLGALGLRRNRPIRALDGAHRPIGVDSDEQRVAKSPRLLEVAKMPHVKQIEHAVGEDDGLAGGARRSSNQCDPLCNRHDLKWMSPENRQACCGR